MSYVFIKGCLDRSINLTPEIMNDNLSVLIFGDDNLGSVSNEFKWFNCRFIEQGLRENFGMYYTSPSKEQFESDFLEEKDIEFLCRRFAQGQAHSLGYSLAPIAINSIVNILSYVNKPKQHESINSKISEVKQSVECELCHLTPRQADNYQKKLNKLFNERGIPVVLDWKRYAKTTFMDSYRS